MYIYNCVILYNCIIICVCTICEHIIFAVVFELKKRNRLANNEFTYCACLHNT